MMSHVCLLLFAYSYERKKQRKKKRAIKQCFITKLAATKKTLLKSRVTMWATLYSFFCHFFNFVRYKVC